MKDGKLGKYEIRGTLGKGAMGTVYDGFDVLIDRRVAIKTMPVPDATDEEARDELARFRREAQAAGRLTHPNIVAVYDYGEEDNLAYIVMEYAPGKSLKDILDKGERLPVTEIVRVMDGLLTGLQFSHDRGVVHRDIKPGNIIITPSGMVKIADFGIARIESSSMTQAGTVMGTPAYMSPEQFMGQTVDSRTDIYSSGVMLYQLLTGERPFEGGMTAIMHKALNTEPPKPSQLSVTSPSALDAVVARAMGKRPEQRFDSAATFAQAIHDAVSGASAASVEKPVRDAFDDDATMVRSRPPAAEPAVAAPPSRTPSQAPLAANTPGKPTSSKLPMLVGIGSLLLVAGGGAYFLLSGSPETARPTTMEQTPAQLPAQPSPPPATPLPTPPAPVLPATPSTSAPSPSGPSTSAPPTPIPLPSTPASTPSAPPAAVPLPSTPPAPTLPAPAAPTPPMPITQAPAPQAPPQATPAMIRNSLVAAFRPVGCSTPAVSMTPRGLQISGLAGSDASAALHQASTGALSSTAPDGALEWHLDVFAGPAIYCRVLDLIRPQAAAPAGNGAEFTLGLQNGVKKLHKDDEIVVQAGMPEFAGYLTLDYFANDGTMSHLTPSKSYPTRQTNARVTVTIGGKPSVGTVDVPFGTDMVLAVVSSAPLFAKPRPDDDTADVYLEALQSAIADATHKGVHVTARAMLVETSEH